MIKVSDARRATESTVAEALLRVNSDISAAAKHLSESLGKGVRSLLLLNAAADEDGDVHEDAVKAAAAIELLHMATLVHDDIIDDSPLRRGLPTVQSKFGKKDAVICGDYLLCMSLSTLTGMSVDREGGDKYGAARLAARFSKTLGDVCVGEYTQNQNRGNFDLDELSYLRIISGKTAALFYVSAFLGGLLGGETEKDAKKLGRFGKYLGMIFQMVDDCKDYEFSEEQAQKPVGGDVKAGIVTLPLIFAMRENPSLKPLAAEVARGGGDALRLIDEVKRLGGTERTREVAGRYAEKARAALRGVSENKRARLLSLLDKTVAASGAF